MQLTNVLSCSWKRKIFKDRENSINFLFMAITLLKTVKYIPKTTSELQYKLIFKTKFDVYNAKNCSNIATRMV